MSQFYNLQHQCFGFLSSISVQQLFSVIHTIYAFLIIFSSFTLKCTYLFLKLHMYELQPWTCLCNVAPCNVLRPSGMQTQRCRLLCKDNVKMQLESDFWENGQRTACSFLCDYIDLNTQFYPTLVYWAWVFVPVLYMDFIHLNKDWK